MGKNHVQRTLPYDWCDDKVSCELFEARLRELLKMVKAGSIEIKNHIWIQSRDSFFSREVKFSQ